MSKVWVETVLLCRQLNCDSKQHAAQLHNGSENDAQLPLACHLRNSAFYQLYRLVNRIELYRLSLAGPVRFFFLSQSFFYPSTKRRVVLGVRQRNEVCLHLRIKLRRREQKIETEERD